MSSRIQIVLVYQALSLTETSEIYIDFLDWMEMSIIIKAHSGDVKRAVHKVRLRLRIFLIARKGFQCVFSIATTTLKACSHRAKVEAKAKSFLIVFRSFFDLFHFRSV